MRQCLNVRNQRSLGNEVLELLRDNHVKECIDYIPKTLKGSTSNEKGETAEAEVEAVGVAVGSSASAFSCRSILLVRVNAAR